jgi:hypothetical protein
MGPGLKIFPMNLFNGFRTSQTKMLGRFTRPKSPGLKQRAHAPIENDGLAGTKKCSQRSQVMLLERIPNDQPVSRGHEHTLQAGPSQAGSGISQTMSKTMISSRIAPSRQYQSRAETKTICL